MLRHPAVAAVSGVGPGLRRGYALRIEQPFHCFHMDRHPYGNRGLPTACRKQRLRGHDDGKSNRLYRFKFSISTAMPCPAPMHMLMTA